MTRCVSMIELYGNIMLENEVSHHLARYERILFI
jgi:hypothetical protein